jgi:hypothetical protein
VPGAGGGVSVIGRLRGRGAGRNVTLYVDGDHEQAVLQPIGAELARRGAQVRTTTDFDEPSDVGLYACHANRFFDYETARWRRPPSALSVLALHDLGQAGALDAGYFTTESWHAFDLGLLPGGEWSGVWERAVAGGASGPALGMAVVGWPKMDHVFADPASFGAAVEALRGMLGLGSRPVVVLACSWSDRRQLTDALAAIATQDVDLVVKYPASGPPPTDSPWFARLTAAYDELQRARELALAAPRVTVVDDDTDIMTLLATADVVLSNGSNVLYEGILLGVPGVSIRDWTHPAGRSGDEVVRPHVDLPGVLAGDLAALPTMLSLVRAPAWAALVQHSSEALVDPATRGTAAARAADAIEAAMAVSPRERAVRARDIGTPVSQGTADEQAAALSRALSAADEREAEAREQLREYERILDELGYDRGNG